jgi:hypothetical protein
MLENGDLRNSKQWSCLDEQSGRACQELLLTVTRHAIEEILGDIVKMRPSGGY